MSARRDNLRAALLLETVVALAIMVGAMGLLAAQLTSGLDMTSYAEHELRVSQMTERVLALIEFDLEISGLLMQEDDREYDFDQDEDLIYWGLRQRYPEFFWRIHTNRVEPDNDDLWRIEVEILYQPDPDLQGNIEEAEVVRHIAFLKARPTQINLDELNLTEENLSQLGVDQEILDQLPDLLSLLGSFDMNSLSLQQLIQMVDRDRLQTLMPMIRSVLGQLDAGSLGNLSNLGGLGGLDANLLQQLGGGGDMPPEAAEALQRLLEMAGSGEGAVGGSGGRPRGPRGNTPMGHVPRPGGGRRSGGAGHSVEDLFRMREQYQRKQEGG